MDHCSPERMIAGSVADNAVLTNAPVAVNPVLKML
jgi:hypothetical protein